MVSSSFGVKVGYVSANRKIEKNVNIKAFIVILSFNQHNYILACGN
jgi:hypothetical protein